MAEVQPVLADSSDTEVSNGNPLNTGDSNMDDESTDKQGVKRPAEEQLGPDDVKKDEDGDGGDDIDEPGEFPRASDDVMSQRTVLAPVSSTDQSEEEEQGATGRAKPFKLNPPTLIHGVAKSAPKSDDEEEDPVKPLLRPSALNHHVKSTEDLEKSLKAEEEKSRMEGSFEGAVGGNDIFSDNAESEQNRRTNIFLRLTTGDERDMGFGVFGKFRDPNAYRYESEDGKAAGGNGEKNRDHEGETHENYFMQFASKKDKDLNSAGDSPSSLSSSSGSSFLFGQNMNERVTSPNRQEGELQSVGELVFGQNLASRIKTDGFGETSPEKTKENSLAENASALEEARERMRRKFEDVESKTGEEDEENVLQSHCKLFVFDPIKRSWLERGRGQIRLNDKPQLSSESSFQSRLVMRTQGSLRLILNTKLFSGMTVEKASQKSLRLSAMDSESETFKVFLVTGTAKDIEQLYCAIEYRVQGLKHMEEERLRSAAEGTDGAAADAGDDDDVNDEEDDDEDDEDEDSEVAKICSRDRSKPTSPKSSESASASPAIQLPEESS